MLGLVEFLSASGLTFNLQSTKVHLACWNGFEHPLDVYFAGNFQAWQEHQNQRNFECEHVLSLIDLGKSRWLFAGVYDVHGRTDHPAHPGHHLYATQPRSGYENWSGGWWSSTHGAGRRTSG